MDCIDFVVSLYVDDEMLSFFSVKELPTVIKTKDKISSDILFSCLSHTIRINRQYLASNFKDNNRIETYCRKVSSLILCSKNLQFPCYFFFPSFADYHQGLKYFF